jgi:ribosomal protein L23
MNKQEIFEQITELFNIFVEKHNKTTKKSQQEARKSLGNIKNLVTEYRKASVAESK